MGGCVGVGVGNGEAIVEAEGCGVGPSMPGGVGVGAGVAETLVEAVGVGCGGAVCARAAPQASTHAIETIAHQAQPDLTR